MLFDPAEIAKLRTTLNSMMAEFIRYANDRAKPAFYQNQLLSLRKEAIARTVIDALQFISDNLGKVHPPAKTSRAHAAENINTEEAQAAELDVIPADDTASIPTIAEALPKGRMTNAQALLHPTTRNTDQYQYYYRDKPVTLARAQDHLKSWDDIKPGVLYVEYIPTGSEGVIKNKNIIMGQTDPRISRNTDPSNNVYYVLFIYYVDKNGKRFRKYDISDACIPDLKGKIESLSIADLSQPRLLNQIIEKMMPHVDHYQRVFDTVPLDDYSCPDLLTPTALAEGQRNAVKRSNA